MYIYIYMNICRNCCSATWERSGRPTCGDRGWFPDGQRTTRSRLAPPPRLSPSYIPGWYLDTPQRRAERQASNPTRFLSSGTRQTASPPAHHCQRTPPPGHREVHGEWRASARGLGEGGTGTPGLLLVGVDLMANWLGITVSGGLVRRPWRGC